MSRSARRRRLPDLPDEPAAAVRSLRAIRKQLSDLSFAVRPFSPLNLLAQEAIGIIDRLGAILTGDPEYFWDQGSVGGADPLEVKLAREEGRTPWVRKPERS